MRKAEGTPDFTKDLKKKKEAWVDDS